MDHDRLLYRSVGAPVRGVPGTRLTRHRWWSSWRQGYRKMTWQQNLTLIVHSGRRCGRPAGPGALASRSRAVEMAGRRLELEVIVLVCEDSNSSTHAPKMRWDGADLAIEVHLGRKDCAAPECGSKSPKHVGTRSAVVARARKGAGHQDLGCATGASMSMRDRFTWMQEHRRWGRGRIQPCEQ